MGLFDTIKGYFVPSKEENQAAKSKLLQFMKQALKRDELTGFQIVYGKSIKSKDGLLEKRTQYYNYAVAFNRGTGELVILPVDPKLASCGWPVFINEETLKSAKKSYVLSYVFDLNVGDFIDFEVPEQNYKIGKLLGALELPIMQEEEAAAFKEFFKMKFG